MTSSISRRSFLKGSVATATAASLAACGGSDGDSADGSKKIVRWGQGNPKLGLDMQKSTKSGSSNVSDPRLRVPSAPDRGDRGEKDQERNPLAAARRITRIIRLSVNRVIA